MKRFNEAQQLGKSRLVLNSGRISEMVVQKAFRNTNALFC